MTNTQPSPASVPVSDGSESARIASLDTAIWQEVHAERVRAHAKHGKTSMEALPINDPVRFTVLTEEVGEVARALNDARHDGSLDVDAMRAELIQVAAMAGAWADALTDRCGCCQPDCNGHSWGGPNDCRNLV